MAAPARRLTARQLEIIDRMSRRGATATKVAAALGISEQTVKNHLSDAYREYDVHALAQLVRVLLEPRRGST